jgi:hypothetical protein
MLIVRLSSSEDFKEIHLRISGISQPTALEHQGQLPLICAQALRRGDINR